MEEPLPYLVLIPGKWGDIEVPDWSISEETFLHFAESLGAGK